MLRNDLRWQPTLPLLPALAGGQGLALAAAVSLFASALTATIGTAHTWRLRSR